MPLAVRHLTSGDLDAAMRLKEAAGWNQVRGDWEAVLQVEPEGCFAGEVDGWVVATATAVKWDSSLGWIGMVLVDPAHRRQGHATRMMERCIEYLEPRCSCIKLDATDDGARVYSRMGFQHEYTVQRWRRPEGSSGARSVRVLPLGPADLPSAMEMDRQAFGADRGRLLDWYVRVCGGAVQRLGVSGTLGGFALGRPGSSAFQMGPVVAESPEVAAELMAAVLEKVKGPVIADFPDANPAVRDLLRELGFVPSRVLYRMFRGTNQSPGDPRRIFCLAGFEWG
jgi:GNAT superfamily N-acetyltransferase